MNFTLNVELIGDWHSHDATSGTGSNAGETVWTWYSWYSWTWYSWMTQGMKCMLVFVPETYVIKGLTS